MPPSPPKSTTRPAVDERALQRAVRRMQAAPAPWLHGEVARRMGERLAIVRQEPGIVVDWWSHIGAGSAVLAAAYPRAEVVAVEPVAVAREPAPWWSPRRWSAAPSARTAAEVTDGQARLVWANMMLHLVADPLAILREWHRALAVDGFLMFSTLGPGTLEALRSLYAAAGWGPPMAPLVDMHDLGDMLVEAGFADPVMDQESLRLTWRNASEALSELRSLGSNVALDRAPGLRTPHWRRKLLEALDRVATHQPSGQVQLTFEIVYGHAFKPQPRVRMTDESAVPMADMRAMLRGSRTRRP